MNPSPFPHSSRHFTSSASIPNPSPPPPNPCAVASDLSATLANLKSLITLSEQTLTSLSTLLPLNPHKEDHVPCPFNPHHRMPPEALFSHHLRCPFNLDLGHAVESLNYPKTLKSSAELAEESSFVQALPDSNADLYFTLDEYIDFRESLNFFYKDCPGVVSFPTDGSSNKRNFTLPGFLSVECANFFTDGSTDIADVNAFHIQLFPSEFWWVQNEVTGWTDYPSTCSYYVVYALSGVGIIRESDLRRLVIVNSPRTGIVIDVAMTDHITVLLSLCLKAIAKESLGLMKSRNSKFNCPILVQAATWLASQLRILYGEMSGKSFAIDLLKKCLLDAASRLSVHSFEQKLRESRGENSTSQDIDLDAIVSNAWDVDLEKPVKQKVNMMNDSVNSRVIFLSQVAAAIAALHERFVLEVKIRALRQSQHVPRYQQLMEHVNLTKIAEDERRKRSNYRPIIDHDGFPRRPPPIEESSKTKTREELLAEERDYKRRRMSYRGKKSKRNPSEVLRDIIHEYTEEIKQAGGIGCFVKAADGNGLYEPLPSSHPKRKNHNELSRSMGTEPSPSQIYVDQGGKSSPFNDTLKYEQQRKYQKHIGNHMGRNSREELDKDYYFQSPERSSYGRSRDHSGYIKERNSVDADKIKHYDHRRSSSNVSNYREYKSSSRDSTYGEDGKSKSSYRGQRRANDRYSSDYEYAFEDRYEPSRSTDLYEDEAV